MCIFVLCNGIKDFLYGDKNKRITLERVGRKSFFRGSLTVEKGKWTGKKEKEI